MKLPQANDDPRMTRSFLQEEERKAKAMGLVGRVKRKRHDDDENFSSISRSVAELGATAFWGKHLLAAAKCFSVGVQILSVGFCLVTKF